MNKLIVHILRIRWFLIIFIFISLFLLIFVIYSYNYISNCSNNIIITSSDNDFSNISIISNLQNKLKDLYHSNEKIAYLTFDDGPTKFATPKILDILKSNNVHASFFVIGYRVNEFPELIKREYEEGHFIANHGYSHKNSNLYKNKSTFIDEILSTDNAISNAIGISNYHSYVFRFPNGSATISKNKKNCKNYLKDIGYCYVDWNALNNDSIKKYSSTELLNNLKKSCKNKNALIILMHDTNDVSKSYSSLDESIKYLKNQGYEFRTFYDLIK